MVRCSSSRRRMRAAPPAASSRTRHRRGARERPEMADTPIAPPLPLLDSSRIAHGGKAIYGAKLGILMLEARFPRIPGDMGNAATWPFPVLYHVVKGASPKRVVEQQAAGLLDDFRAA